MVRVANLVCLVAFATYSGMVFAHTPEQPPHQKYEEGNLKLESGEVIEDFSVSYVTHGTLNEKKTNAILMTSSIAGNHHRIDFLIGPGKALDTDKYFIIATTPQQKPPRTRSTSLAQNTWSSPHFRGTSPHLLLKLLTSNS
jgi:homoserine O-acetyltransferase/O-succinyltransferase